jgi:hypothetical protein
MGEKSVVTDIRRLTGFPELHWKALCEPMIKAACENTLQHARRVLTIRQGVYLPAGACAEDIYRLRDVWTYAVLVTALRSAGMDSGCVPAVGMAWIEGDAECIRSMKLALVEPPAGVIAELITRVSGGENASPSAREKDDLSRPGQMFIEWLREGIKSGSITVNAPGARVHVVEEGVLIVTPGAFKDFDADHWQVVQGDLLAMGVHLPRGGKHMRCWNVHGRDGVFVRGILLADASLLFDSPPDANPELVEAV